MTKKELAAFLEALSDNAVIFLEMYDRRWRNVDCLRYDAERNVVTIGHWRSNWVDISLPVPSTT